MKGLKNNILSLIEVSNSNSNLTFGQQRIIKYINYGAFAAFGIPALIVLVFLISGLYDFEKISWLLGVSAIYLLIPFVNRLGFYELSKVLTLVLVTLDLVSFNLYVYDKPFTIILPFIIANIFYNKLWIRTLTSLILFVIYCLLSYEVISDLVIENIIIDFSFFTFLFILILFLESSVESYEQKMNTSIRTLRNQNDNLSRQQKLKKSEQFFTSFFENSQLGFVIINKEGTIINLNQTFVKQLKCSEENLFGRNFFDLNELNESFETHFNQLLNGVIKHFEIKGAFIKSNQEKIITNLMINGVYDDNQVFLEAIITIHDITLAEQANKQLQESELKFKSLFYNSPLGITIRYFDNRELVDFNQRILDRLKLTREEFIAIDRDTFILSNISKEEDARIVEKIMSGEISNHSNEMVFYNSENEPLYVEMIRSKIKINGRDCLIGIFNDHTEKTLLEHERKRRYQEMQTFFDALPISFIYIDNSYKIQRVNNIVRNVFKEDVEGKYLSDLFPEFEEHESLYLDIIETGIPTINKVEQFVLSGEILWQKVSRIPVKDEDGNVEGIMIFSTDITAIKDAQTDLVLKNAELEHYIHTNLQLESFAYIASHDLKEPLRMIYSFTQLLNKKLKPHFDKEAIEFMDFILDGTKRMQTLLDDLLEYSTIGRKETGLELVNLTDTVYNVVQNLQLVIQEKSAEINIGTLPQVQAFPMQMIQLFQNLISNALKFVEFPKSPIINIEVKEVQKEYIFSIEDNGIGIEEEYLDKIFLVFKRLHGKEIYKGTGIGLATCKKIIENHKGKIWVISEIGVGTTFYFSIPKIVD